VAIFVARLPRRAPKGRVRLPASAVNQRACRRRNSGIRVASSFGGVIPAKEEHVDPQRSTGRIAGGRAGQDRWEWKRWTTWRNLGILLGVVVLPFGCLLPVAQLARVRAAARRHRHF
jgi:hypothetical protein